MASTTELIDESVLNEEGNPQTDPTTLARWRSCFQEAMDLVWDSQFWSMKLVTLDGYAYDHLIDNFLPDNFSSFEALGASVFGTSPERPLSPVLIGQMNAFRRSTSADSCMGLPTSYSVDYIDGRRRLWIAPFATETLNLIYLRKKPRLAYNGINPITHQPVDSWADEMTNFPEEWQRVIQRGGEWRRLVKSKSDSAGDYAEMFQAGLQEMRARERNSGLAENELIAPWRP